MLTATSCMLYPNVLIHQELQKRTHNNNNRSIQIANKFDSDSKEG